MHAVHAALENLGRPNRNVQTQPLRIVINYELIDNDMRPGALCYEESNGMRGCWLVYRSHAQPLSIEALINRVPVQLISTAKKRGRNGMRFKDEGIRLGA